MFNTFLFIAQAGGAGSAQLLLIGGIFVIMYFFMIRPQQKRMAEHKDFIANLKAIKLLPQVAYTAKLCVLTTEYFW